MPTPPVYRFGPFVLDPAEHLLTRNGTPIPITGKSFDILLYLVQHPNRLIPKQDLMKAAWPDTFVEDGNLTQHISLLRKALAEHGDALIVTVARQGYRFAATVTTDSPVNSWRRTVTMVGALVLLGSIGTIVAWQRSRATPPATRLAVLPFDNLTGDPAQDYLADGLTEELISHLGRLHPEQLDVIARTSVMGYKHSPKRIDEIGRELSVRYAIESSLRRSADSVRVTVQLIRVQDQGHVWAQDFDYAPQDVLHIEDAVADAVTREIQLRLTPADRARLARAPSTNAAAVDAFLHGRDLMQSWNRRDNWESAKRYFDQAIALDSSYALAWAWLAMTDRLGADREFIPTDSGVRGARAAAKRALALDPNLPEAYAQLGQIQRFIDWNWSAADSSFQHALALDPDNVDNIMRAAGMALSLGRLDQTIALNKRAVQLDPLDVDSRAALGETYYYAGQLDKAAQDIESALPDPGAPYTDQNLVQVYLAQGRTADAAALVDRESDPEWQLLGHAYVYFAQGRHHAADGALADYIARYASHAAYQVADLYAFRRDPDHVFPWLDRAYAQLDEGLAAVKTDPLFVPLHHDPRYTAFLTKLRLPL